jgi:2-polyprenyl-3-methyl-5-hydroxy-6-metoxy-1,4-benzoquinol methylase
MSPLEKLISLYGKSSKHSNYQVLSSKLAKILGAGAVDVESRYERERLEFIQRHLQLRGTAVLDIGGNTGFFTLEALDAGACFVHCFEGNPEHASFVKTAASVLGCADRIEVTNAYYDFRKQLHREYDVAFLLNVLHHLGDDFGGEKASVEDAKSDMADCLLHMADVTEILIFQLGFCWKGDRHLLMFPRGTKQELVEFVADSTKGAWSIEKIGVPTMTGKGKVSYELMSDKNSSRDDAMGEFLNRPLFIMRRA